MLNRARSHVVACALVVLPALLAFSRVIGPKDGLAFRDTSSVFKPLWWSVIEAWGRGELASLTPWSGSGVPLDFSMNAAVYTPLAFVFGLGDFGVVYDLFVLAHVLLLGLGAYLLAVFLGARPAAAALVAIAGSLSGPVLSTENVFVMLQFTASIPIVLLALGWTMRRPGLVPTAALAAAVALHLQSFMPELAVFDVLGAALLWWHTGRPRSVALIASLSAAAVLGFAMASIDFGPTVEAFFESRRGQGFSYAEAQDWHLTFFGLLDLFVPAVWTLPDIPFIGVPASVAKEPEAYLTSVYLGLVGVFC